MSQFISFALMCCILLFKGTLAARGLQRYPYKNFNFDYSSHNVPIAYSSVDNTVELFSKVKLNPSVPMRGGAYILESPLEQRIFEEFELDVEFTINSEPAQARAIQLVFTRNEPKIKDFQTSQLGFRTDYEGLGIYMFRHMTQDNKWYLMMVQNSGVTSVFKGATKIESALVSSNSCFVSVEKGKRMGIRVQFVRGKIRTEVMDNDDYMYRYCQEVDNKEP